MATRNVKVEPFDLVVFGGTGDLAYRKLYPALFHRERSDQFSEPDPDHRRRRGVTSTATRSAPRVKDALTKFNAIDDEAGPAHGAISLPTRLCRRRRDERRRLGGPEGVARPRRTHPRLLSCDRPGPVRPAGEAPRRGGARDSALAHHRREADRQGRRERRGDQRCDRLGVSRAQHLPHRPLSRQGIGAESDGAALRQHSARAAVEQRAHRPRADHRRRDARRRRARRLLRRSRRDARHGPEPYDAAPLPRRDGAAEFARRRLAARREAEGAEGARSRSTKPTPRR